MFIKVIKATYRKDYQIETLFNIGESGIIDLAGELWGEVFEPLKELENFRNFSVNNGTIEWYNGADLAPEYLLSLLQKNSKVTA